MTSTHGDDLPYRVALHRVYRMGAARFALLEAHFGSLADAWRADHEAQCAVGLDPRTAQAVVRAHTEIDPAGELARLTSAGIAALAPGDPRYPARLAQIVDSPPVLYARGEWLAEDEWSVAVVGTRWATAYGRQVARPPASWRAAWRPTA